MKHSLAGTVRLFILVLVLVLGCGVLTITWLDARATTVEVAHQLIEGVAARVERQVTGHVDAPARTLVLARQLLGDATSPGDGEAPVIELLGDLAPGSRASMLGLLTQDGRFLGVEVVEGRVLPLRELRVAGALAMPILDAGKGGDGNSRPVAWSAVTTGRDGTPAIVGTLPVDDAEGAGHLVTEVSLEKLSRYLATLPVGVSGEAFIVDSSGSVIASGREAVRERPGPGDDDALRSFLAAPSVRSGLATGERIRARFVADGAAHLGSLAPIPGSPEGRWRVGVVVPEDDFLGDLKRTMWLAAAALVALLAGALAVGEWFSGHVRDWLASVEGFAHRIERLDFSPVPGARSTFRELDEVMVAFESMKAGLRSFSRYVPAEITRRLVAAGVEARPGGETRTITLLFTDVENFTTLAESADPEEVARRLSRYFEALASVVQSETHRGVVDKYIGDSLMAFWGGPEPMTDHALRACRAALDCVAALEALEPPPWPREFRTRFGLHTDRVLVGNIGGEDRLSYTAIGDGVNLASRIEGLNQLYGTTLLATAATREAAGDIFRWRRLDRVRVKGRTAAVDIFELLGLNADVDARRIRLAEGHEEALDLYQRGAFAEALGRLEALDERDEAAERLLRLARKRTEHPPGPGWTGETVLDHK